MQGLGFRVPGFRVYRGLGIIGVRDYRGLGFRVSGLGFVDTR